jgi:hypothetical protein
MDEYTYVIIPAEDLAHNLRMQARTLRQALPAEERQIALCTVEEWRSFGCGLTLMIGIIVVCCGVFSYILITRYY